MAQVSTVKETNLVNGLLTLECEEWQSYSFTVPPEATNVHLKGAFIAAGGGGNDIELFVMDSIAFRNWQNNHGVKVCYSSGRLTETEFDLVLSPGDFCIVFSNVFSSFSRKRVKALINVNYEV